jgi:putative ABC transport system permease protein
MFDLEKTIKDWKSAMRRSPSIDEADLAELERYLRDKVEDLAAAGGLSQEEAFLRAEDEFRRAGALDAAYGHVRAARPGRRFPWKKARFAPGLLWSNVRIALRRLRLQKAYSLINIGGLSLGLTTCLLVFLWVQDEVGYDRFHERAGSIAQVYNTFERGGGESMVHMGSFYPLATALKAECPEVAEAARIQVERGLSIRGEAQTSNTDAVALADPSLFKIFTFPFVRGDAATALEDKFAVVLTERMARKYFGDGNPIGRTLRVNGEFDVRVSAVIRDVPAQSSLRFDAVVPFVLQFAPSFQEPTHWGGNPLETWVLLSPGAELGSPRGKDHGHRRPAFFKEAAGRVDFRVQPLFARGCTRPTGPASSGRSSFSPERPCSSWPWPAPTSPISARPGRRRGPRRSGFARPWAPGRRTSSGSSWANRWRRRSWPSERPCSSWPCSSPPSTGSPARSWPSTPSSTLEPHRLPGHRPSRRAGGRGLPGPGLSSFQARTVLAGRAGSGLRHSAGLRKGLVVFQFALSLVLVLGTAVVGRQLAFIKSKDLGFDRSGLVVLRLGPALDAGFEGFKADLLGRPGIVDVTAGLQNPVNIGSTVFGTALDWPGKDPAVNVTFNWDYVDYDYFETLKTSFAAGRPFSRDFPSDAQGAFVVNEAAARLMGLSDPVGQRMRVFKREGTIVGVVKDFHFRPLRVAIQPIVFELRPSARSWAFIRIAPGTTAASLGLITETVKRLDPDTVPQAVLFDDMMVRSQYFVEQRIWTISNYLSVTAVFIACIGLFGLASFLTERRTKEIGIRKVMGASASGLTMGLAREFLLWVGAAVVVALPIAYWVTRKILGTYAYRAPFGAGFFALAALAMLALAALTVGTQTLRAARANPVDSLRYE